MIHFYHLWLGGDWKSIVEEHFNALRAAEFPGVVQVGLVGSAEARAEARRWLDRRWSWKTANAASSGFEEVTLRSLHRLSESLPGVMPILYMHNKGSFHAGNGSENESWRREMTEHLVGAWQVRVGELAAGYDVSAWRWLPEGTLGPDGKTTTGAIAAGNFWWATAGYLGKLPELPSVLIEENRILAEAWLGQGDPEAAGVCSAWPQVEVQFKFIPDGSGMAGSGRRVPVD